MISLPGCELNTDLESRDYDYKHLDIFAAEIPTGQISPSEKEFEL